MSYLFLDRTVFYHYLCQCNNYNKNDVYVHINNIFKILHRCTDKKKIFQIIPHRVAQSSANNAEVQFILVSPNDVHNTP